MNMWCDGYYTPALIKTRPVTLVAGKMAMYRLRHGAFGNGQLIERHFVWDCRNQEMYVLPTSSQPAFT
jgi:hypothetical protein